MSESGDFDPGVWTGYDFGAARKSYDVHVGRSYDDAVSSGKSASELLEDRLKTNSESPLVIACDVTGSMGEWPAVIFSKLPYLELEGKEYLGETMEISFAAVGDAYSDNYPLQVRKFAKGKDLEKRLKELVIEGNGGGQTSESYDLAALYYARNVDMPKAIKPIFIFIGDEGLYEHIDKAQAKEWARTDVEGRLSTPQVIKELQAKYSVYLVRKMYGSDSGDGMSGDNRRIGKQWEEYLGADHIAILPKADRVVDVIFGILAKETGRIDYFRKEITDRQTDAQVRTVMKSLHTIHELPNVSRKKLRGGSMMRGDDDDNGTSKSLL